MGVRTPETGGLFKEPGKILQPKKTKKHMPNQAVKHSETEPRRLRKPTGEPFGIGSFGGHTEVDGAVCCPYMDVVEYLFSCDASLMECLSFVFLAKVLRTSLLGCWSLKYGFAACACLPFRGRRARAQVCVSLALLVVVARPGRQTAGHGHVCMRPWPLRGRVACDGRRRQSGRICF